MTRKFFPVIIFDFLFLLAENLPLSLLLTINNVANMSGKGWWIGMAVAAAVVYYGTYALLPFK